MGVQLNSEYNIWTVGIVHILFTWSLMSLDKLFSSSFYGWNVEKARDTNYLFRLPQPQQNVLYQYCSTEKIYVYAEEALQISNRRITE